MQKLITASLLLVVLVVLVVLQTNAFAATLDCKFKDTVVNGVKSIQITDDSMFINKDLEIPLEKSRVNCGHFGRQTRLDGGALGYQVVLKSCSTEAKLEGHLIDSLNSVAAELLCDTAKKP